MAISTINQAGLTAPLTLTSPVLTTPNLGTPSAINLSNATALPKTALPTGSVLQVVQGSTQSVVNTTSGTPQTTGLSATITPSSASSKIMVFVSGGNFYTGATTQQIAYQIYRNGSVPAGMNTNGFALAYSPQAAIQGSYNLSYLDSPASTSALTYALYFWSANGGGSSVSSNGNSCFIYMQLMEIAG